MYVLARAPRYKLGGNSLMRFESFQSGFEEEPKWKLCDLYQESTYSSCPFYAYVDYTRVGLKIFSKLFTFVSLSSFLNIN